MSKDNEDVEASITLGSHGDSTLDDDASFELEMEDPLGHNNNNKFMRQHSDNRFVAFIQHLAEGPEVPRDEPPQVTNSLFVGWEQWPALIRSRFPYKLRVVALVAYLCIWYVLNHALLLPALSHAPHVKDSDMEVVTLSCTGDGYFWKGKNAACGHNGEKCSPFEDRDVIVKCPALCDRGWTFASTPVGEDMVKYRQYSIGGGALEKEAEDGTLTHPYRADSFPCASAVHAGVLSPFTGGCVRLSFNGTQLKFTSKNGYYGTGMSVEFPTFFPSSFVFKALPSGVSGCYDPRLVVLALNVVLGAPIAYFCPGQVAYWVLTIVGFWTITLTLDPPVTASPENPASVAQLISTGFARMLPLCFVLYTLWHAVVSRTFDGSSSPLFKLFLWYPLFWIGTANVITFDRLPLDRFTPADIAQQPGALVTAISVLIIIVLCAVVQAYHVWRAGLFVKYLFFYWLIIIGFFFLSLLPNLVIRVHHYILALLLLPGCATRGVTAYALQGILLGLLLSGVARWDFASVVETHVSLLRGEAGASAPPPTNIVFERDILKWDMSWPKDTTPDPRLDGVSIMVNDVEIFVDKLNYKNLNTIVFQEDIKPKLFAAKNVLGDVPLYIRIARASTTDESLRGDYTRAGKLSWPSKQWVPPPEGRS